jgi:hypothetical protein
MTERLISSLPIFEVRNGLHPGISPRPRSVGDVYFLVALAPSWTCCFVPNICSLGPQVELTMVQSAQLRRHHQDGARAAARQRQRACRRRRRAGEMTYRIVLPEHDVVEIAWRHSKGVLRRELELVRRELRRKVDAP